jgi:hypothetical protein
MSSLAQYSPWHKAYAGFKGPQLRAAVSVVYIFGNLKGASALLRQ